MTAASGSCSCAARRVCRGYWGRDRFAAGDWFATGDLVSVAGDGYVTIRGRRTELIITGGHNVYPAEVEAVLARHPGVVEVAVVGLPSAEWGETVVAYVVGDPDLASLQASGRSRAGAVQVPARGAPDRRPAAQCAGQGGPGRAALTGPDPGDVPAPAVACWHGNLPHALDGGAGRGGDPDREP